MRHFKLPFPPLASNKIHFVTFCKYLPNYLKFDINNACIIAAGIQIQNQVPVLRQIFLLKQIKPLHPQGAGVFFYIVNLFQ